MALNALSQSEIKKKVLWYELYGACH